MFSRWYDTIFVGRNVGKKFNLQILAEIKGNIIESAWDAFQEFSYLRIIENYEGNYSDFAAKAKHIENILSINVDIEGINTDEDMMNRAIPIHELKAKFELVFLKEIEGCEGCSYASPGQEAHMSCPNGCLHNSDDCSYCEYSLTSSSEN